MGSWNYTFDDADVLVNYAPCADCNLTAGWAPWNSGSGGFRTPSNPGEYAEGQSLHYTYTDGASFEFSFHGTAIYLFGSANCTYDVSIDSGLGGSSLSSPNNVLFANSGLPQGTHFVNVTAHATAAKQFAFDSAIVTDDFPTGAAQLVTEVYDNSNSSLQYSGNWQSLYDTQIPSKSAPKNYTQTSQSGASVTLNFTGAAIAIHAPVNWGHWLYNVTLDNVPQQYNASTFWLVGNDLLFYQSGLDPSNEHEIKLINTGGDGMVMNLNDITVYAPPSTTNITGSGASSVSGSPIASTQAPSTSSTTSDTSDSSHHTNVGAIVGPVVAVVVVLTAMVLGFIWWRRNRVTEQKAEADLTAAPWYGGYNIDQSSTRDPEKAGLSTLGVPVQSYNSSSAAVAEPPNPSDRPAIAPTQVSTTQLSSAIGSQQLRPLPQPPAPASQASSDHQSLPSPPVSARSQAHTQYQSQPQGVDVNTIIELIAQRIDRAGPSRHSLSPPQYPSSEQ